jgi:hypothetical protein
MESGDLKNRVYRLRQELEEIAKANQAYFNGKNRQGLAKKLHEARQIRTVEIRSELASLMKVGSAHNDMTKKSSFPSESGLLSGKVD